MKIPQILMSYSVMHTYVYVRAQTRIDHDESFLCVEQFVDRWIAEELTGQNSAKCLILIGELGKGP